MSAEAPAGSVGATSRAGPDVGGTDERLDRTVALKAIRGESDDTSRKRLWREARAAAGISHPNICQRRLDPHIQTSVLNTHATLGDQERILRDPDLHDSDARALAERVLTHSMWQDNEGGEQLLGLRAAA